MQIELLPSFIPIRAAEKILFVGESVQMFENQKDSGPKQINRGMLKLLFIYSSQIFVAVDMTNDQQSTYQTTKSYFEILLLHMKMTSFVFQKKRLFSL